jgi:nitrate reductase delta subunit
MRILKVISRLLDYPVEELKTCRADLAMAISEAREISPQMRLGLLAVLAQLGGDELLDAQENYGVLFDQGRSVSLHLFEHVHGESRDRGQAMVDLIEVYGRHGFELDALELPDYLPLFIEYLASRPDLEIREWLGDVAPIVARVAARLEERGEAGKHYALLLEALLMIAGRQDLLVALRGTLSQETPDHTPEAIDQEWEETAVTFSTPDKTCGLDQKPAAVGTVAAKPAGEETTPLHWVDAAAGVDPFNNGPAPARARGNLS